MSNPVRWIGSTATMLVGIIFLMVIIVIPALLSFGRNRPELTTDAAEKKDIHSNTFLERIMEGVAAFVIARPVPILMVFFLGILTAIMGLRYFEVNFDIRKNMGDRVPYVNRLEQICESPTWGPCTPTISWSNSLKTTWQRSLRI